MIWARRIAWLIMWCGLLVAIALHHDVRASASDTTLRLFVIALAGIVIGLAGAYFTARATTDGWGP